MPGRNAMPLELIMSNGNKSHLTKAEIARRKKSEIKLGEQKLTCPAYVRADKNAYKKWRELKKLYDGFEPVSTSDTGMIGRYCMAFSEYLDLLDRRNRIAEIEFDDAEADAAAEILEAKYGSFFAKKLYAKIDYVLSTSGLLSMDKAINAKMDTILKMEDRLFLSPLAKVKNVPKKQQKEEDPMADKGFDGV